MYLCAIAVDGVVSVSSYFITGLPRASSRFYTPALVKNGKTGFSAMTGRMSGGHDYPII